MSVACVVATASLQAVVPSLMATEKKAVMRFAPVERFSVPLVQIDHAAIVPRFFVGLAANPFDLHFGVR